jgi:HlyD family secretion protein
MEPGILNDIFKFSGLVEPSNFLILLALGVLLIILLSSMFSIYTTWKYTMFGNQLGADIGNRLYKFYLKQPWLFHSGENSTKLITKIAHEGHRTTYSIINPALNLNAKFVSIFFIAGALFLFNPMFAVLGATIFGLSYFIIFSLVKFYLDRNGKVISNETQMRFRLMSEGFGGIRDTLLLGRQSTFTKRFDSASNNIAYAMGNNQTLTNVPRFFIELVVLSAIILLILFLLITSNANILPIISIYALSGLKLLPGFQQVYTSLSVIRSNIPAFDALKKDLLSSQYIDESKENSSNVNKKITFSNSIKFKNISFSYPRHDSKVIEDVTIEIPINSSIGIVGPSGSGKSTAVDLLLGLLTPSKGQILIDQRVLDSGNLRDWQNKLGYVPQSIYLSDSSIKENIAFGLSLDEIDESQIFSSIKQAHLEEFINSLPEGVDTIVGERGVQLSGGQRQRIGIARALYSKADVLILDEATSSLDGITEKTIMNTIHDFSGKKTIIMIAHRLATVKECDLIFLIEKGKVVDQGSFDDLKKRNKKFMEMTKHA